MHALSEALSGPKSATVSADGDLWRGEDFHNRAVILFRCF